MVPNPGNEHQEVGKSRILKSTGQKVGRKKETCETLEGGAWHRQGGTEKPSQGKEEAGPVDGTRPQEWTPGDKEVEDPKDKRGGEKL